MESTYRMWVRERKEGSTPEALDEHSRELQTALGTAKWQLEEFERAVRLSHGHHCDDISASRHEQFVAAIGSQIAHVEASLREAFILEGKQLLQWVNLNKEECDDLAMFLSGTNQTSQIAKPECTTLRPSKTKFPRDVQHKRQDREPNTDANASSSRGTFDGNSEFIIHVEESESPGTRNDIICQGNKASGSRRTWSSPNFGSLKIVIADEDEQENNLVSNTEPTPKEKGSRSLFWRQRCQGHSRATGPDNLFDQLVGYVDGLHRQLQTPLHLHKEHIQFHSASNNWPLSKPVSHDGYRIEACAWGNDHDSYTSLFSIIDRYQILHLRLKVKGKKLSLKLTWRNPAKMIE